MAKETVIIVGAGLIGVSVAYHLTRQGARVIVVDAGRPACGASGHSFGWINASFFADDNHHRLRVAGIEAWRRLHAVLPDLAVRWPGCLWWEEQGAGLVAMEARLRALDYPVECITARDFASRASGCQPVPEAALMFPGEGVAEAERVTEQLLDKACASGARVILGCEAQAIEVQGDRAIGLRCAQGVIAADRILVAAGNGSADLMRSVGVVVPMLRRPGALVRTRPLPPMLDHIMVSPELEFRQDGAGRIIAPASAAHQADDRDALPDTPDRLARDTLRRLGALLPDVAFALDRVAVALRPVPGDGLPVVGPCGPEGLYLAVMHSGVTLAALMGELVATEMLQAEASEVLQGYRPQRFLTC